MKLTEFSIKLAALLSLMALGITYEVRAAQAPIFSTSSTLTTIQSDILILKADLETDPKNRAFQEESLESFSVQYASIAGSLTGGAIVGGAVVIVCLGIAAIIRPREVLGLVRVPDGKVGILIKTIGRPVPNDQLIARKGEAGPQADTLSSGWHFFYWPLIFTVLIEDVTYIAGDEIGWIEAKDGAIGTRGQTTFGQAVECDNFQDGKAFLNNGGQRGTQQVILTTGTYRINTELFIVHKEKIVRIEANEIGIVEARDGAAPERGRSFARSVECDDFQDEKKFFENGGQRGTQLVTLGEGTYQINLALFKVRKSKVTSITPGEIGLVTATDGAPLEAGQSFGRVVRCDDFQNADAFLKNGGQKGEQLAVLRTGNYQINTDLFTIEKVPATKIESGEVGLVKALGGASMPQGRNFGKMVECNNFQDANAFLENGGQKGNQLSVLGVGIYYINTYVFEVVTVPLTEIGADEIGLIEAQDGAPLEVGQTLGRVVDCHNFEDANAFIGNGGQKGKQLAVLPTGNYQINTNLFSIRKILFTDIDSDQVGLVEAQAGEPLRPGQTLGQVFECNNFQDAQAFLNSGGQKGKQLGILIAGKYRINTDLFKVRVIDAIKISPEEVGLVEAKGGAFLKPGQSFGQVVNCNDFQDATTFLRDGGQAGRQLTILTTGTYYINTDLFNIRIKPAIQIVSDQVGLVEAKAGFPLKPGQMFGQTVECDNFQDAQLFFENEGQRGKQLAILTAGTYQINTDLFNVRFKPVITIEPEEIGLVEAKDGAPLEQGKIFGKVVDCDNFQDPQKFFANGGQRGQQLAILAEGTYYINTELFSVRKEKVVLIGPDEIGLVIANDGAPLEQGQTLARIVDCNNFQDAQAFLANGGQKGKQLAILTAGLYRINTNLFTVITPTNATQHESSPDDLRVTAISGDSIGIVITHDGRALEAGEIAGSIIPGHDKFQNAQQFIDGGGQQGLQEEILPAGRWNLNPWFVKVESVPFTEVPNGHVGVIKSYVGQTPVNNEKLVPSGYKGICRTPLRPGIYPINIATKTVVIVPTNDLVLKWSDQKVQGSNIHKTLPALKVHDKDGFTFAVEVTQVIRVKEEDAPEILCSVASTVNSVDELIKEVLEPTVVNYFLIAAHEREALDFQRGRGELQAAARQHVKTALKAYNIQAIDTLIGEISLPEKLTDPLRQSKIAEQEKEQFRIQAKVEEEREKFNVLKEMAVSAVDMAKVKREADIAEIKRAEKNKELQEGRSQEREDLLLWKEKQAAEREAHRELVEIEAAAKELIVNLELKSDKEKKEIDAAFRKAINDLATDEIKLIKVLGSETYERIRNLQVSKQAEIAGSIALIQASVASQSHDLDKTRVIAEALGNNNIFPNLHTMLGGESLDIIANHFGVQQSLLFNMLNQSNPNLLNSLGMGQFGFNQLNSNPQLKDSLSTQSSTSQSINPPNLQHLSRQIVEPRCPVLLLLDTSAAMSGECIQKLNEGIDSFKREIQQDLTATQRLEVTVVTFNETVQTLQRFDGVDQLLKSQLVASGPTNMGQGIELALREIDNRISFYRNQNIQFHKPWVFLIIGGLPTDDWQSAAQHAREVVEANKLNFFVVGVQGADITTLRQIAPPNVPPVMLDQLKFQELFHWLASSMKMVANSQVGSSVNLSPITTWAQIN